MRIKVDFFANCQTILYTVCPFHSHKISQCWINKENLSPGLKLIIKAKKQTFFSQSIQFFIDEQGLLLKEEMY